MARIAQRLEELPSLESLPSDMLLTLEEAAAYLGIGPSTLEKWRLGLRGIHGGPPSVTLHDGPRAPIRFMVADLRRWIRGRRTDPSEGTHTPARCA